MALATASHRRIGVTARHRRPGMWQRILGRFLAGERKPAVTFAVPLTLPPDATSPGLPIPPRICAGRVAGVAEPLSASPHSHIRTR